MPRTKRVILPEFPHHIVQRGHNRQIIFAQKEDFFRYIENIKELKVEFNIKIFAYCLMTNHIHLLMQPGKDVLKLPLFMKKISGRTTRYFNLLEGRSGTLWESRYKSSPVQKDEYLLACCRYIELNPVRAGITENPGAYPWSSYIARTGGDGKDWLDLDPVFLGLGETEAKRLENYQKFIQDNVAPEELKFIRESIKRGQLTGNSKFEEAVEQIIGRRIERRAQGRPFKKRSS
ncbi:MAG: transposase [bacterium]|jgi:putative transposase